MTRSSHSTPSGTGVNVCWWCHSAYGPRTCRSMNWRGGDHSMIFVRQRIGTPSHRIV